MSAINEIVYSFFSYAKRPHLYPELGRKIIKNIFQRNSATKGKEIALNWCKNNSISQQEAVKLFHNENPNIFKLYPEAVKYAIDQEKKCPVKMGGAGALNLIYAICENLKAKNVLETGVAYGWSTLAILLSLQNREAHLYSSDMPYATKNNEDFVGIVIPTELRKQWSLYRFADRESLPKIFKKQDQFDFIHYDSDKAYNGRMWAYNILWSKISKDGILMSDDIADNSAFMDFCNLLKIKPVIVNFDDKYAGILIKS